jgi:Flp pilus assembly secretin CpaC
MLICSRNREDGEMKVPTLALKTVAILLLSSAMVVGSQEQPASSAPNVRPSQEQPATEAPQAASQAAQPETQSAAPLRVMVGKSLLLNTKDRIKRVSVTDATIADPLVVAPTQILVHGRAPGEVSLLIWDELERSRSFDLRVDVDVSAVAEEEKRVFPDEQIAVTPSRSAVVLSGHVSTEDVAKRAGMIADAYSKNVVNVLTFGPVGAQEILEVRGSGPHGSDSAWDQSLCPRTGEYHCTNPDWTIWEHYNHSPTVQHRNAAHGKYKRLHERLCDSHRCQRWCSH